MQEYVIHINPDGTVTGIYDDAIAPIIHALGKPRISRASHVEPTSGGQWTADMAPVGGPILGPFDLRAAALRAEYRWLERNLSSRRINHA